MQGDIVTYDYFGGLYINMTNRCDCHCVFCIRDQEASALGGLWLQEEPAKEAVLAEILAQDLGQYTEIVFCGYGEPTCRADDLFWLCDQLRAAGRADLPPIRLNTNGHGSLINHRDITPELKGRLDAVSVSLNGSNREEIAFFPLLLQRQHLFSGDSNILWGENTPARGGWEAMGHEKAQNSTDLGGPEGDHGVPQRAPDRGHL